MADTRTSEPFAQDKVYGRGPGRPSKKRLTPEQFFSRELTQEEQQVTELYRARRARGVADLNARRKEFEWDAVWTRLLGHPYAVGQFITTDNNSDVNLLASWTLQAAATLSSGRIKFRTQPLDPDDTAFSKGFTPWTNWLWTREKMRRKAWILNIQRKAFGIGYMITTFDPYYYMDKDIGDCRIEIPDPRTVWYDPSCPDSDIQSCSWWGRDMMRDSFHVARVYGLDLGDYDEALRSDLGGSYGGGAPGFESTLTSDSGLVLAFTSGELGSYAHQVSPTGQWRVTEFNFRTAKYPKGRSATFLNDVIVPDSIVDNRVPGGMWNITSFPDNPMEGLINGRSSGYLVLPLLEDIDHCLSIMADWRDSMVWPPFICAKDTGIADNDLHPFSRFGLRPNTYEQGKGLGFLNLPAVSTVPQTQIEYLSQMGQAIFNVNMSGSAPSPESPGLSGQALRVIQEQYDVRLTNDKDVLEPGFCEVLRIATRLFFKYGSADRIIRLGSEADGQKFLQILGKMERDDDGKPIPNGRRWFQIQNWKDDQPEGEPMESFADPELDIEIATGTVVSPSPTVLAQQMADLRQRNPQIPLKYELDLMPNVPTDEIESDIQKQQDAAAQSQQPQELAKSNTNWNLPVDRLLMFLPPLEQMTVAREMIELTKRKMEEGIPGPPPDQGAAPPEQGAPPQQGA
jgi:hypothetical protein